ncbi:MAG: hypothetical protein ACSHX8_00495 [Opitutaceae bacterium]
MLKPKSKGLYIDVSEFSVLAARTSGYKLPMVIEEIAEMPLQANQDAGEVRAFLEQLVDLKGDSYFVSRCGVYPEKRFARYYEAESASKVKNAKFLTSVLQSEFNVDVEAYNISVLDARDGSDIDFERNLAKRLVFCGAPKLAFREEQDKLLECGIYPDRLELSTVTTLGGLADYSRYSGISGPILCFEITSKSANIAILNKGQVDVSRPVPFGLDSIYPLLQRELGLKDEGSAKKLFFSNTFDFAEMGSKLLRRMTKELQATTGFYEVQTGQTIENVFLSVLPKNLNWVSRTVADSLGLNIVQPNLEAWLDSLNVTLDDGVEVMNLGSRWLGLFSLMGEFKLREESAG